MHTLAIIVAALDRFEWVEPAMEDLGARHAHYGVLGNHYETVEDALVWALEQTLGPAFTTGCWAGLAVAVPRGRRRHAAWTSALSRPESLPSLP